ncbi:MAG: RNA polymerase sigma factor [Candidatus Nealsonbacteria bacterium]|nr:RNA polymerase sigma factor [Candidatus Nealsonbacteria bacterium]
MEETISQLKDEEIAQLIQSGKVRFFGILVSRYENKIRRYARKFLSDKEDINDIVQEVFIKAYTNIQEFDSQRKFSPWFYRIAHNELVNALKKRKKQPLFLFDFDVFFPYDFSNNNILNQQIDRQNMEKIIDMGLDQLEPKYREPIILYYLEELTYKEIADVMQIPISTVGIRIKRAKKIIKPILKKLGYNYE